jgi:hypothetical protein
MQKRLATTSKEIALSKPILQQLATWGNRVRRIVALEKVAGSSPVGHPLENSLDKLNALPRSIGAATTRSCRFGSSGV